jgi:hypothetical protein
VLTNTDLGYNIQARNVVCFYITRTGKSRLPRLARAQAILGLCSLTRKNSQRQVSYSRLHRCLAAGSSHRSTTRGCASPSTQNPYASSPCLRGSPAALLMWPKSVMWPGMIPPRKYVVLQFVRHISFRLYSRIVLDSIWSSNYV